MEEYNVIQLFYKSQFSTQTGRSIHPHTTKDKYKKYVCVKRELKKKVAFNQDFVTKDSASAFNNGIMNNYLPERRM